MAEIPRTRDFWILPIPQRCRRKVQPAVTKQDPQLSLWLNLILAGTSTFTIANLYYPQPILVQLAERYQVSRDDVTIVASLIQAGYLVGLLLITPLGDLVPRRPLLLALVFLTAVFSLGQALVASFVGFQALSFIVGLFSVTPQIVNPLTADLAAPGKRALAVSITVSGLLCGWTFGRVVSGVVAHLTNSPNNIYFVSAACQFALLIVLYLWLPDFAKKDTGLGYFGILKSMLVLFCTSPVLVQACLVGYFMTTILASWWTCLTFLLSSPPYSYDTFEIGLFGLTGIVAISVVPWAGRLTDRLDPWFTCSIAAVGQTIIAVICLGTAALNLAPVIIACICVDLFHQGNTIGNQSRIYRIDPLARGRINGVYMAFVFAGQATGSAVGPKLFLREGWRAAYALHVALGVTALLLLMGRGPNTSGWIGWKRQANNKAPAEDQDDLKLDSRDQHDTSKTSESLV
ncbi:MFS transporter [Sporobolomyces koalae]|uniref:MFS transporter n=1 Tax=Sporobolomyces koalae TaxID=500713 RepID=UPI003179803E